MTKVATFQHELEYLHLLNVTWI